MTNEQMREDFEAECRRYWGDRCPDLDFVDGKYDNNGRADLAWRFWQTATLKATEAERERCEVICCNNVSIIAALRQIRNGAPLPPTCTAQPQGTGGNDAQ